MSAEEFHDTSHGHRPTEEAELSASATETHEQHESSNQDEHHRSHEQQAEHVEVPPSMEPQSIDGFDEVISPEVVEWAIAVDGDGREETESELDEAAEPEVQVEAEAEQPEEQPQDEPTEHEEAPVEALVETAEVAEAQEQESTALPTDSLEAFYKKHENYFATKTAAEFIEETHRYTELLAEVDAPQVEMEIYEEARVTLEGVFPAIEGDNGPSGEPYTAEQKEGARTLMNMLTESLLNATSREDAQKFWKELATEALTPTNVTVSESELFATPNDELLDKTVEVARHASEGFLDHTPRQQYQLVLDLFNDRKSHVDQIASHAKQALKELEDRFNGNGEAAPGDAEQNEG